MKKILMLPLIIIHIFSFYSVIPAYDYAVKDSAPVCMFGIYLFIFFAGLFGYLYYAGLIPTPGKIRKEGIKNKTYFLITTLKCSKGEAIKILDSYKWNIRHIEKERQNFKRKKCPECGFINSPESNFCFKCGSLLWKVKEGFIDVKTITENEIRCFDCNSVNLSAANFCKNCEAPLDGKSLLEKLTMTIIPEKYDKITLNKPSQFEKIPFKIVKSGEDKEEGDKLITSLEFTPDHLVFFLNYDKTTPVLLEPDSVRLISVYREGASQGHVKQQKNEDIEFFKYNTLTTHKERYVAFISTGMGNFRIVEGAGKFDFQKILGKDKKLLFKDNLRGIVEKLFLHSPGSELDIGALNLLGIKDPLQLRIKDSDFTV